MIDIDEIERIAKAGDPWGYAATPTNVLALIAEVRALRSGLLRIASIENKMVGGDWDEIEEARQIAAQELEAI